MFNRILDITGISCAVAAAALCGCGGYGSGHGYMAPPPTTITTYAASSLVADTAGGMALAVDARLVNPWGLSIPAGMVATVANNGTQTGTFYDGKGVAQPQPTPRVIQFAASAAGAAFDPTGIAVNASASDFVVSNGTQSAPATFLYVGEGGMVAGWSASVDATHAVTTYTDAGGAVYKALTVASLGGHAYLYAADFHNAKVDVFDTTFARQATSAGAFTFADPAIPAGYAPFGIQAMADGAGGATQIYVAYAQQLAPADHDNVSGAGLGFVDVFDTNGQLLKQLVAHGALNAPWGLALAPADFGVFSHALLVGNFGDGRINAFDPASGAMLGTLSDAHSTPIAFPGLWGLAFGNDGNNQPHNTLFFTAGVNNEANGLFGRIDLGAAPPGY